MNSWQSRIAYGVLLWLVLQVHASVTESLPNSIEGMTLFHATAALFDLVLLLCAPAFLDSRLCDDMQSLCLVSIVGNAFGWLAYLAYAPPVLYTTFMWGLCYVQWGRLLLRDSDDNSRMGSYLVRRNLHGCA